MTENVSPKSFKPEGEKLPARKSSKKISNSTNRTNNSSNGSGIPKYVANRMAKRIAITTGLPTFSGMGVFVASYIVVSKGIADIPPALTLLVSAACFLVGLLGLSYGILSSSWEIKDGSLLGLENIRPNIGRVRDAIKSSK